LTPDPVRSKLARCSAPGLFRWEYVVFQDRIIEFRRIDPVLLVPHERNWRTHPERQERAIDAILREVGIAGALIVRPIEEGRYQIIDGHLRSKRSDEPWPCLVLDVTEEESEKLILTFDAIGTMADANAEKLRSLLGSISFEEIDLQQLTQDLASIEGQDWVTSAAGEHATKSKGDNVTIRIDVLKADTDRVIGMVRSAIGDQYEIGAY